jgi:hypothetical protein
MRELDLDRRKPSFNGGEGGGCVEVAQIGVKNGEFD